MQKVAAEESAARQQLKASARAERERNNADELERQQEKLRNLQKLELWAKKHEMI